MTRIVFVLNYTMADDENESNNSDCPLKKDLTKKCRCDGDFHFKLRSNLTSHLYVYKRNVMLIYFVVRTPLTGWTSAATATVLVLNTIHSYRYVEVNVNGIKSQMWSTIKERRKKMNNRHIFYLQWQRGITLKLVQKIRFYKNKTYAVTNDILSFIQQHFNAVKSSTNDIICISNGINQNMRRCIDNF